MTNRRIAFHLGILLTLITIGVAMRERGRRD